MFNFNRLCRSYYQQQMDIDESGIGVGDQSIFFESVTKKLDHFMFSIFQNSFVFWYSNYKIWMVKFWSQTIPNVEECKKICSRNDSKWQWVHFDSTLCYCIDLLENGNQLLNKEFNNHLFLLEFLLNLGKCSKMITFDNF